MTTENTIQEIEVMPVKRADVTAQFAPYKAQFAELKATAETITITDRSQVAEMKKAREIRLSLKAIRVAIEKKRKDLGEDALRQKQAIDALAKNYKDQIEPLEERLEQQEKFAELLEAKERAELLNKRREIMAEFAEVVTVGDEVADMSDEMFAILHDGAKTKLTALKAMREKAEQDRISKEQAEKAEQERIRVENERLKAEQARIEAEREAERKAAAAELAKQQAEAEAKLKAERTERERIEREAKAEADRLAKIEADRIAAEKAEQASIEAEKRTAELAPTKNKIKAFAESLKSLEIPVSKKENEAVNSALSAILENAIEQIRELYKCTK
jgi:fused signal recognition particle receptor